MSLKSCCLIALLSLGLAIGASADEAGICGMWQGEVVWVTDTGQDQVWANAVSPGDPMDGYFMKRGAPAQLSVTQVDHPWNTHRNTTEFFSDFHDWAMNVHVNGLTLEHDSKTPTDNTHRMWFNRFDTITVPPHGARSDTLNFYTDYLSHDSVAEELNYFNHYMMSLQLRGDDEMVQTPPGLTAGMADFAPLYQPINFGGDLLDSYGVVRLRSFGGFAGSGEIVGKISNVQTFPCAAVGFDAGTGQYFLIGGEGEDD